MAGDPFSSHPYPAIKEILSAIYYCELCDKEMKTKDKNAHLRGKKHSEKMAESTKNDQSNDEGFFAKTGGCHNCGQDHLARDCTEPRKDTRACHHCGEVGHGKADCPALPRQTCFNCGEEGHRKNECTKERTMICKNCEKPGHMSKECPEPPNPANFKCNNCEKMGHKARDCPEPKDWSKVRCNNCGLMGHTIVRCKAEPAAPGPESGWDNIAGATESWADSQGDVQAGGAGNASWDDTVVAKEDTSSKPWDDSGFGADEATLAPTPVIEDCEKDNTYGDDVPAW